MRLLTDVVVYRIYQVIYGWMDEEKNIGCERELEFVNSDTIF
jgi:hypothetical protein